jgi:uncharacterized membrane protein
MGPHGGGGIIEEDVAGTLTPHDSVVTATLHRTPDEVHWKGTGMREERPHYRATVAGILIGIGMGGFVDGIVLHQIAQWHQMLSNIVPPHTMDAMRVNMTWDGLFHALTWIVTLVGILLLRSAASARAAIPSLQAFTGQLILGWGLFNLVEGIIASSSRLRRVLYEFRERD